MIDGIRNRLQADLTAAMRRRDRDVVAALRTTLSAIANAETVDASHSTPRTGVGTNDVERRALTTDDMVAIVAGERDRLLELSAEMGRLGQRDEAARLHAQAAVLDLYLETTPG